MMVACGKKNINKIPGKLRRALRMEHNHHILFLISDETDKNSSLEESIGGTLVHYKMILVK